MRQVWDDAWDEVKRECPSELQAFAKARPQYIETLWEGDDWGKWDDFGMAVSYLFLTEPEEEAYAQTVVFVLVAATQAASTIKYVSFLKSDEIDGERVSGIEVQQIALADLDLAECITPRPSSVALMDQSLLTRHQSRQLAIVLEMLECKDWFASSRRVLEIDPSSAGADDTTERLEVALGSVKTKCGRGLN